MSRERQTKKEMFEFLTKSSVMANVMAALPNTGGALCSTPQFGCAVVLPIRETR